MLMNSIWQPRILSYRLIALVCLVIGTIGCASAQSITQAGDSTLGGISIEERVNIGEAKWQLIYLHEQSKLQKFDRDFLGNKLPTGYDRVSDRLSMFHYELLTNAYWETGLQYKISDRITSGHKIFNLNSFEIGGGLLHWLDKDQHYRIRVGGFASKSLDESFGVEQIEARLTHYSQGGSDAVISSFSDRRSLGAIYRASQGAGFKQSRWIIEARDDNNLYFGHRKQVGNIENTYPQRRLYSRNVYFYTFDKSNTSSINSTIGFAYQPSKDLRVNAELFGGIRIKGDRPLHGFRLILTKFF